MADGESANPGEVVMFTTNGEGWQHIGEWYKNGDKSTRTYAPQDLTYYFDPANNFSYFKPVPVEGIEIRNWNTQQLVIPRKRDQTKSSCLEVFSKC